jgi:hypothetical protein
MDALIFLTANRGRTMQSEEDRPKAQPARAGVPRRTSAACDDLLAMNNVAAQVGGAWLAVQMDGDSGFPLKIFSYKKEILKARLACAEKEAEMIKKIMEEYESAENSRPWNNPNTPIFEFLMKILSGSTRQQRNESITSVLHFYKYLDHIHSMIYGWIKPVAIPSIVNENWLVIVSILHEDLILYYSTWYPRICGCATSKE